MSFLLNSFVHAAAAVDALPTVLLHMDGAEDGTAFPDVMGHSVAVTGAVTKTGTKKFGAAAGLFETGDRLIVSPATTGEFLTDDDWTIEFWLYAQAQSSQGYVFAIGAADCRYFVVDQSGALSGSLQHLGGSATHTNALALNTWTHVAITREGAATRFFLNGTLNSTTTYTAGSPSNSNPGLAIGYDGQNFGNSLAHYKGYIDDFRFTNGVALYTASFTPPSAAFPNLDAHEANVLALLHFDEADGTTSPALALGSATVSNTDPTNHKVTSTSPKFGAGCWSTSGDGGLELTATTSSAEDYTIEFFVKPIALGTFGRFFAANAAGGPVRFALCFQGGALYYIDHDVFLQSTTGSMSINNWYHIAICRGSSVVRVYLDGVSVYSSSTKDESLSSSTYELAIGHTGGSIGGDDCQCRFDEVRWTHGVDRYPSGLSVPAEAYPD